MAAEAVINLKAIDSTRSAFASVQASLGKLKSVVTDARNVVKGFFTLFGAKMAFDAFNNALRDVEKNSERLGTTKEELDKVTRATGAIDEAFGFLKKMAVGAVNGVLDLKDALLGVSTAQSASIADKVRADRDLPKIKELDKALGELLHEFDMIGATPAQQFQMLADAMDEANNAADDPALSDMANQLTKLNEAQKIQNQQAQIASKVWADYEQSVNDVSDAYDAFQMKQLTAEEKQAVIVSRFLQTKDAINSLQEELAPYIDGTLNFSMMTADDIANMEQLTKLQKEYIKLMGEREILETTMQKIGRQAGESIAQSLEDAVFVGGKLSEVLKNLANDILRLAFKEAVTAPLGTGLGSFFKNLFRADGGPVGAGSPYIVGERGPELFVPRSSGSIVSNDNLAGATMGGGGGVNITYNISGGMNRAELMPILEQERKRLKAEIPDMVRRGGAYRAAFA